MSSARQRWRLARGLRLGLAACVVLLVCAACGGRQRSAAPPDSLVRPIESEEDGYRQTRRVQETTSVATGAGAEAAPTVEAPQPAMASEPAYEREALASDSDEAGGEGGGGGGGGSHAIDQDSDDELVASSEPGPLRELAFAIGPGEPRRAMLAMLDLPPGHAFHPPASSCQDVLVLVREGLVEASGSGIAPPGAPATLYRDDAMRFGPEGDGLIVNPPGSTRRVRTLVAIARRQGTGAATWSPPWNDTATCPISSASADPRVRTIRLASAATTPVLSAGGGHLQVRILLDEDGVGARHGGLALLAGDTSTRVPEHVHETSAEILWIEDGTGTMTLGAGAAARTLRVEPGLAIYVPAGTPHSFTSDGDRPLRAVQVYAPAGPEQRFRQ